MGVVDACTTRHDKCTVPTTDPLQQMYSAHDRPAATKSRPVKRVQSTKLEMLTSCEGWAHLCRTSHSQRTRRETVA